MISFIGSGDYTAYLERGTITDGSISYTVVVSRSYININYNGGNVCINPGATIYSLFHGYHVTSGLRMTVLRGDSSSEDYLSNLPSHSNSSGGIQLLPYKTSSPYDVLILCKQGTDNVLYYSTIDDNTKDISVPMSSLVILTSSFNDFCGCSEAQVIGDSERIHLVYIKSTGELCYRKFEDGAWNSEIELIESGSSYPVIAVGDSNRLYIFYAKNSKIYLKHYNGSLWKNEVIIDNDHTFTNPTYLSCNQNVQSGKICLTWTEGDDPYEVWFTYIDDSSNLITESYNKVKVNNLGMLVTN